mmetsp:Transcript_8284/g.25594  ORF Transcript_8284/g.25594 Transcript_8284/m.25594 type:complete len:358 (-) Transcript_8284:82-1155(-)
MSEARAECSMADTKGESLLTRTKPRLEARGKPKKRTTCFLPTRLLALSSRASSSKPRGSRMVAGHGGSVALSRAHTTRPNLSVHAGSSLRSRSSFLAAVRKIDDEPPRSVSFQLDGSGSHSFSTVTRSSDRCCGRPVTSTNVPCLAPSSSVPRYDLSSLSSFRDHASTLATASSDRSPSCRKKLPMRSSSSTRHVTFDEDVFLSFFDAGAPPPGEDLSDGLRPRFFCCWGLASWSVRMSSAVEPTMLAKDSSNSPSKSATATPATSSSEPRVRKARIRSTNADAVVASPANFASNSFTNPRHLPRFASEYLASSSATQNFFVFAVFFFVASSSSSRCARKYTSRRFSAKNARSRSAG